MDRARPQGSWEALVFYVNRGEDRGHPQARGQRAVVRGPDAVGRRSTASRACAASPPTPSTSSSRPATPGRSRRSASTCRTIRRSARSTAASRCRCRTSTRPTTSRRRRSSAASSPGRRRRRARREVEQRRRRADDQHARGDRPRLGQGLRAAEGQPADGAEGAVLGARGGARRPRRALFHARPEARRARARRREGPRRDRAAEYEGYTRNALVAAPPHPRGHADRRRPHAQPPDDRPLADGELEGDRRPRARRQDLLRDGRRKAFREGVGRLLAEVQRIKAEGDYEAAARSCSRPTASTSTGAARRGRRARRAAEHAVLHRLRAAAARGGQVGGRQDHRRQDLVSAGPDDADAGVFGVPRRPLRSAWRSEDQRSMAFPRASRKEPCGRPCSRPARRSYTRRHPWHPGLDHFSRTLGRLPIEDVESFRAVETFLRKILEKPFPQVQDAPHIGAARGLESLARLRRGIATLDDETIKQLENCGAHHRSEARRSAAQRPRGAYSRVPRRCGHPRGRARGRGPRGAPACGAGASGSASTIDDEERLGYIAAPCPTRRQIVRLEGVRAWTRRGVKTHGCQPLLDRLADDERARRRWPRSMRSATLRRDEAPITSRMASRVAHAVAPGPVAAGDARVSWPWQSAIAERDAISMLSFAMHRPGKFDVRQEPRRSSTTCQC